jgi:hypothetical protein
MNAAIHDPKAFLKHFCRAAGSMLYDPTDRACVITRSPSNYGREGTVIIEWEGSPPGFPIYFGECVLIVNNKLINRELSHEITPLIRRFLEAYPANEDGSPVWIGTRRGGRA